jgi:hypothetical protein
MSPYGNRDGASSRASSIKTACTSRLWWCGWTCAIAVERRRVLEEERRTGELVLGGVCMRVVLGVWSDEMVGLSSHEQQHGLDRLLGDALIRCGSYDLRSSMQLCLSRNTNIAHSSTGNHARARPCLYLHLLGSNCALQTFITVASALEARLQLYVECGVVRAHVKQHHRVHYKLQRITARSYNSYNTSTPLVCPFCSLVAFGTTAAQSHAAITINARKVWRQLPGTHDIRYRPRRVLHL